MPIYGIVAQDTAIASGGGPLPDPLAVADFANGIYTYGVTTLSASQVVNNTGTISGSGLHLVSGASGIQLLNQFRSKMFEFNWTILFELDIDASAGDHVVLHVGSETPTFGYTNELYAEVFGDWYLQDQNNDYPGTPPGTGAPQSRFAEDFTNSLTNAFHKFGVTRTDSHISLSVDGFAVETTNTPTFSINAPAVGSTDVGAVLGAFRQTGETIPNSFYIRKLQVFDPVSNATLVAMTA